jgi:hypothetical protein
MRTWTGLEATLLRLARRMTVRQFADHLGITSRMVTRWSTGGPSIRPRPEYQLVLDESLRRCTDTEQRQFYRFLRERDQRPSGTMSGVRWCLVVDVPAGDSVLMDRVRMAVNAIMDDQSIDDARLTPWSLSAFPGRGGRTQATDQSAPTEARSDDV